MTQLISTKVKLTGLHCEACKKIIAKRLKRIADVQEAMVDLSGNTEIIAMRPITTPEVIEALQGTQYTIITN